MAIRFVIIGGGPAGNQAATHAARLGADVVLVERDVVGGAAHLWDCIPSKAMIATGGAMAFNRRSHGMGLTEADVAVDLDALKQRIAAIESRLNRSITGLLESQGVRMVQGSGRLAGPHEVVVETADGTTEELHADAVLLCTGSRPRIPDWCHPDGDRILTTRQAYPPPALPEHLVVVGSGVTGVEFVHMFSSFGSKVTLIVSRQQVLPQKDPEVAAALEQDFVQRGVVLLKGARAMGVERDGGSVIVHCDDGRKAAGTHTLLAIGSLPNSEGLGLEDAGIEVDEAGYVPINHHCQSNVDHVYAAGDLSGKLPLSSVAAMQGRKIAEHVMGLHTRPPPPRLRQGGVGHLHRARDRRRGPGRGRGVRRGPQDPRDQGAVLRQRQGAHQRRPAGFVKILSDPATGVVLGGSIVGRHAAELISVIAVAVTAHLKVTDIVESVLVHPTLSEALAEAAE